MCNEENESCGCLSNILKKILLLQKQDFDNESYSGCDKPYLGPTCNTVCYNTRPIILYNCCTGNPWSFNYTLSGETNSSNVLRIEALDECCCTCRILYYDESCSSYVGTNEFVTINLNCCGALKCLTDTYIDLC